MQMSRSTKLFSLLPFFLIPCVLVPLMLLDPQRVYMFIPLYFVLTAIFSVAIPLAIAVNAAWAYLRNGLPGVLTLGCGMILFGLGSLASSLGPYVLPGDSINYLVAVFNITISLASAFFALSAILAVTGKECASCLSSNRTTAFLIAYAAALGLVVLTILAVGLDVLPPFFIQGHGSTHIRQIFLLAAIVLLAISATLLMLSYSSTRIKFHYWYSLSLYLLMTGLCGIFVQTSFGSLLNWAARSYEYLSGVYLLLAMYTIHQKALPAGLQATDALKTIFSAEADRKRIEVELWESEARLRFALETAQIGAWELNLLDHTAHRTLLHDKIFGYEPMLPSWTYEMALDHVLPEDRPEFARRFREAISTRSNWDFECRIRRADGEVRWILATGTHVRSPGNDQPIKMAGIVQDITGRKLVEQELREGEAREKARSIALDTAKREVERHLDDMRFIVEATDLGIWSNEMPLSNMNWNSQVKEHFWLPPDYEPGLEDFFNILHPDDREPTRLAIEGAIAEHRVQDITYRTVAPDGRVKWVRAQGRAAYGEDGKPVRFSGITQDITEYKLFEGVLRESEAKYRTLFNILPQMIFHKDKDSVYLAVNANYARALGLQPEQIVGRSDKDLYPPELAEKYRRDDALVMREGPKDFEERFMGEGEAEQVVHTYKIPMRDSDGSVAGVLGVFWDVTERVEAEEQLKLARAESIRANLAKSDFLAKMSHEIRTPLAGIMGMAELVLRNNTQENLSEYLQLLKKSSLTLLSLVNDILDISKIEAGKLSLAMDVIDLRTLLKELHQFFLPAVNQQALQLNFTQAGNTPQFIRCDAGRLRQVLINLVGNAIKFTHAGIVSLDVSPVAVLDGHQQLLFSVRDTGIGIPESVRSNIFQEFSQGNNDTHMKFGGTGLGLAIAKSLVEMMGGSIWVESQEGQGSTFSFRIGYEPAQPPAQAQPTSEVVPPAQPEPGVGPLRLLLAEDTATIRMFVQEMLVDEGHHVVAVADGSEVIPALEADSYDCVLMDVMMEEMDGIEATKAIRESTSATFDPTIPIIAMTAQAMDGDRERFLATGMDGYVSKPIDFEELGRILAMIMQHRQENEAS